MAHTNHKRIIYDFYISLQDHTKIICRTYMETYMFFVFKHFMKILLILHLIEMCKNVLAIDELL